MNTGSETTYGPTHKAEFEFGAEFEKDYYGQSEKQIYCMTEENIHSLNI